MIRVLSREDVERCLPMGECIEVMATALADLARGRVTQPLRTVMRPSDIRGLMAVMPSSWAGESGAVLGLKVVCIFPGNPARGEDTHQGAVFLLSGETGKLLAVLDGATVTAIRTAAVTAVATRLLAREGETELAVIGAGVQARVHLEAIAKVRPLRAVRVASRSGETARRFQAEQQPLYPFPIRAMDRTEDAVRGAGIVVTVTNSKEPVLRREWLAPGTHVNAVGASLPEARELDSETVASTRLFVDRRESATKESGEFLKALSEGRIGPDFIQAEIGEILIGSAAGRRSAEEITLFKSLGLGIEDLAAARHAFLRAEAEGRGSAVAF